MFSSTIVLKDLIDSIYFVIQLATGLRENAGKWDGKMISESK